MSYEELRNLCCADILACRAEDLVDLKRINPNADLPLPARMEQYLDQIRNPYLFRIDKLIVKVSFSGNRDLSSVIAGLMAQN